MADRYPDDPGARRRNPSGKYATVEGGAMIDVQAIALHYGGKVCKGNALIPTPGHSSRDRGTAIKASALERDEFWLNRWGIPTASFF